MRSLTLSEKQEVSGGTISSFTYDVIGPDHRDQMFLRIEFIGNSTDIRAIRDQYVVTHNHPHP
jgi:hypothetical protein